MPLDRRLLQKLPKIVTLDFNPIGAKALKMTPTSYSQMRSGCDKDAGSNA